MKKGFLILMLVMTLMASAVTVQATTPTPTPIPTPKWPVPVDPVAGLTIYQERCSTCHGPQGLGDGAMAAQAVNPPPAIGGAEYLNQADPQLMFDTINSGRLERGMPGFGEGNNSTPLSEAEIWSVIAAVYDLPNLNKPLETGTITGRVENRTSNTPLTEGDVILELFELDGLPVYTRTTSLDPAGHFTFTLTGVLPTWQYRVLMPYQGLEFVSELAVLSQQTPSADLSVEVYEQTTSAEGVQISQADFIVEFVSGRVQINELYLVSNSSQAVYVGESGQFMAGTLQFSTPAGAENFSVWRGLGGPTNFQPLTNQIIAVDDTNWKLPLPIAAGANALRLLVRYELPYSGEIIIPRTSLYPMQEVTLVLSDPQVQVDPTWQVVEAPAGSEFRRYGRPAVAAEEKLEIALTGLPAVESDELGNRRPVRNEQNELIAGVIAFLLTCAVASYLVYQWRTAAPEENERDILLRQLAALDEAYSAQKIRKSSYEEQRQKLKSRLLAVWDKE